MNKITAKELRKELGLKQEDMAHKLGCSKSHVSMIENGTRSPSFSILKKYEELSNGRVTSASFD